MRTTVSVVAHQAPSPEEDPHFRGLGVLAVPGDTVCVGTPDGVLTGEIVCGGVAFDGTRDDPLAFATDNSELFWVSGGWLCGDLKLDVGAEAE